MVANSVPPPEELMKERTSEERGWPWSEVWLNFSSQETALTPQIKFHKLLEHSPLPGNMEDETRISDTI